MRSTVPMKVAKIGYIVMSLLLCVIGLVLIFVPDFSVKLLGILCGIIFLVFGAVKIVGYYSRDLFRLAFQYDLVFGILMIVIGIAVLIHPEWMLTFVCVALGISILADALFKIQIAMDSKQFGIKTWWLILAAAIVTGFLGILLVFRPADGSQVLTVLFGISLLFEGILNMSTVFATVKIIKNQIPDEIEICIDEREE